MSSGIFRVQTANRYSSFLDVDDDSDSAIVNVKPTTKKNKKKSKKRETVVRAKSEVKLIEDVVNEIVDDNQLTSISLMTISNTAATDIEINDQAITGIEIIATNEVDDIENSTNIIPAIGINWFDMLDDDDDDDIIVEIPASISNHIDPIDNGLTPNADELEITNDDNSNEAWQTVDEQWIYPTGRHFHNRDRNANQHHTATIDKSTKNNVKNGVHIMQRHKNAHRHGNDVERSRQFRNDARNTTHRQSEKLASIGERSRYQQQTPTPAATQFANNGSRHSVVNSGKMAIKCHSRDRHVSIEQQQQKQQQQQHQKQQKAKHHTNDAGRFVRHDGNGRMGGNADNGGVNAATAGGGINFWRTKNRAHETGNVAAASVQQSYTTNEIDNNWRSDRNTAKIL